MSQSTKATSPVAPFRHRAFAVMWLATVASNIGTWMNDVGGGWLMTSLTTDARWVALVPAATQLPIFLFALLAGALGDLYDRRKLLILCQAGMGVAATVLGVLVWREAVTPPVLLAFAFVLGTGAAFSMPAFQAIVPKLVPREELGNAITANGIGINISRALGPALGGAVIAGLGLAYPFLINGLTFLAVIGALVWWKPEADPPSAHARERLGGAMKLGLRHAARNEALRATLVRAFAFFLFASAYWAFLPLVARERIEAGPTFYGIMLGSIGVGAVATALVMPRIRARFGDETMSRVGIVMTALGLGLFAVATTEIMGVAAALVCGSSWLMVMTALNVSAQTAIPDWIRARGLAVFQMVFAGSMAGGSFLWGWVAESWSLPVALLASAIGVLVALLLTARFKLQQGKEIDYTPAGHWAEPQFADAPGDDVGPVTIVVEYRVPRANLTGFLTIAAQLEHFRRQDGGYQWTLVEDIADPGRLLESWREDSWAAHLRTHDRVSEAVRMIQEELDDLLEDGSSRIVTHLLPPDPTRPKDDGEAEPGGYQ